MADKYAWPAENERAYIGKRISRVDGPFKVSGRAKYTYDYNPKGLLYGAVLRSPYPKARIVSIDTSAAEKMPGVKSVHIVQKDPTGKPVTIQFAGDDVVAVAAQTEDQAEDALRAIKIQWEVLPHFVQDEKEPSGPLQGPTVMSQDDLVGALSNQMPQGQLIQQLKTNGVSFKVDDEFIKQMKQFNIPQPIIDAVQQAPYHPEAQNQPQSPYKEVRNETKGDPDSGFKSADVTHEGLYGSTVITHCCMEAHGVVAEWHDPDHLLVHISTQSVSSMPGQIAGGLKAQGVNIDAANIRVEQQNVGGGFGSKFSADRWGVYVPMLSKKAGGAPVKVMLERDAELEVAGARPSHYARVKIAATRDGKITAWDANGWGTGGPGGGAAPPLPYVFDVPNQRNRYISVSTNTGPSRAWRAPQHPQAAVITMGALEDLAAKLNMNPVEFFRKNIEYVTEARRQIYLDELDIADKMMNFSSRWHPRGQGGSGMMRQGLGLSIHTWGGRGHNSNCDFTIHPDGSVDIKMGTQDLGTGTRTAILIVAADTLGIPMEQINLHIGDSSYPTSGGSGGSTTIGGVSSSTRRGAVDARDALFAKVAPALGTTPDKLVARNGKIFVEGDESKALTWKQACAKIGPMPITVQGKNPGPENLTNSGVGGVQMADVSVDTETGIVKVNKMVAVQDCGLVIDLKTAESQVLGALVMGVSYALFEEKIYDPSTGVMLNDNMEFYRLAGLGDIPEMQVHMMTGKGYDERGVIGLAEPPTVSPGAAISNAVANAIGVRVPYLPITPDRVLQALESEEKGARA
ncbi:MAG TPA: xanthine dehydrogenase family protein molybdopterin-binding subunit [Terriglobales bacterium]|nr:xanthine dehydrogenase family protein molybdopterin-binding subunit [Terriglobales bacterium]